MNVVIGIVLVSGASLAMSWWLSQKARVSDGTRDVSSHAGPLRARSRDRLVTIAATLDLTIHPSDGRTRSASNEHVWIEHRVGRGGAWRVRIARRGPAWPRFALLPSGESLFAPPEEVRERVRALRSTASSPPFAGWAPPATEAWDELWREARRAAAEVELLEHHDGQIEAWIVSLSAEQTIVQVRRLMRFASAARPAETGPYR